MRTEYYRSGELLGVRTFEEIDAETTQMVFTWAVNPIAYVTSDPNHVVREKGGQHMFRLFFLMRIVGICQVQIYDEQNIPAKSSS